MEQQMATLQANVAHFQSDLTDVRIDQRRMDGKIDGLNEKVDDVKDSLTAKIEGVDKSLTAKIEGVEKSLAAKIDEVKDSLASAKIWALLLYVALAGGLLGVLAHGFKWI